MTVVVLWTSLPPTAIWKLFSIWSVRALISITKTVEKTPLTWTQSGKTTKMSLNISRTSTKMTLTQVFETFNRISLRIINLINYYWIIYNKYTARMYKSRILKEASQASKPSDCCIHLSMSPENIFKWDAYLSGPPDSPFRHSYFYLQVTLDNEYPVKAPKIRLLYIIP